MADSVVIRCGKCNQRNRIGPVGEAVKPGAVCGRCKAALEIVWTGECPSCDQPAAFRLSNVGTIAWEVAENAVGGWLNPLSAISGLKRFVDEIPDGLAYGHCSVCSEVAVVCPNCTVANRFPAESSPNAVLSCNECRCRFRHP
jgi:hypothetical protein